MSGECDSMSSGFRWGEEAEIGLPAGKLVFLKIRDPSRPGVLLLPLKKKPSKKGPPILRRTEIRRGASMADHLSGHESPHSHGLHNLWRSHFEVEHPFASYFDVHQWGFDPQPYVHQILPDEGPGNGPGHRSAQMVQVDFFPALGS